MTHDYQPWAGDLAVQPVRCPCCGDRAAVWQYVEKPGAEVLRVVMCESEDFGADRLPMLLDTCLLKMPPQSFYCSTARQAVTVWNLYAESLNARRAALAQAQPAAVPVSMVKRLRDLAAGVRMGHCPDTNLLAKRMEDIADAMVVQPAAVRSLREGEVMGQYIDFDRKADKAWTSAEYLVRFGMHISAVTAAQAPINLTQLVADNDLEAMCTAFERLIEAHANLRSPFHQPVCADAQMALRVLRGLIRALQRFVK